MNGRLGELKSQSGHSEDVDIYFCNVLYGHVGTIVMHFQLGNTLKIIIRNMMKV
jgi:hypothetical protein